ncbi:MAG: maleylacetoacetate isomerase [Gammaproteobacteria bacterium]|jgi:maleylacetoacetate isomerase|nr:maleylacetoacetate isomerase [Gammaproteobacteria bacterium]
MLKLYDYHRSSACFRVRIAMNLKNIEYEAISVHLVKDGGHQLSDSYKAINPQRLLPALQIDDSKQILTQSLSIIEYLEETCPTPALLPSDALGRAKVRAFSQIIACEIHPLNNLRVLKYLKHEFEISDEKKDAWYFHWLSAGFDAMEALLQENKSSHFCFGTSPTIADICLVPQVYNALRFEFPMQKYPLITKINQHCLEIDAFQKALPENQPDAK